MGVQKSNVYLAVFRSSFTGYKGRTCGKRYEALDRALRKKNWPYDLGDDPSFFSRQERGGALSWGICRPQIRNSIQPGDVVLFFAVEQSDKDSPFDYYFCAAATVERKVRQSDIWKDRDLKAYRKYLNLLVRPRGTGGWEHFEPGSEDGHKDWLWRIARHDGSKKEHFKAVEAKPVLASKARVNGHAVIFAKNYVVFSQKEKETFVLEHPLFVARCFKNGESEEWLKSRPARVVFHATVGMASAKGGRDYLRTKHLQHAHPVIHVKAPKEEFVTWRRGLRQRLGHMGQVFLA